MGLDPDLLGPPPLQAPRPQVTHLQPQPRAVGKWLHQVPSDSSLKQAIATLAHFLEEPLPCRLASLVRSCVAVSPAYTCTHVHSHRSCPACMVQAAVALCLACVCRVAA